MEEARKQASGEVKARPPESTQAKKKRQLKAKDASQLRQLLNDVGVAFKSSAGAKELRKLAAREDALGKWDALDEDVKLAKVAGPNPPSPWLCSYQREAPHPLPSPVAEPRARRAQPREHQGGEVR